MTTPAMAPVVLLERPSATVAVIRANQPPRNAMTPELMAAFAGALSEVRADPTLRALVIAANGDHFCAGADLSSNELPGVPQVLRGPPGDAERLAAVYAAFLSLVDLPIPTVAAVQGGAVGGGFGLACACDFRVVTGDTRFSAPFARLGIAPGMGLTEFLPRLLGIPRAKAMLLLGDALNGEDAAASGFAYRCVPRENLDTAAIELAERLATNAPAVVRWTKAAIHRAIALDVRATSQNEALAQALTFLADDAREGVAAFRERRPPKFTGG